jgi:hypothetical protein
MYPCDKCARGELEAANYRHSTEQHFKQVLVDSGVTAHPKQALMLARVILEAFPLDNQEARVHLKWLCWGRFFLFVFPLVRIFCRTSRRSVSASMIVASTARLLRLFSRAFIGSASMRRQFSITAV